MKTLVCDICNGRIEGKYKSVENSNSDMFGIVMPQHWDVCNKCWDALLAHARIQLVEFPNKEGKDGKE